MAGNKLNTGKWLVVGASVAGKSHTDAEPPTLCQDSYEITPLPRNWGVAVICDGAGSAKYAEEGAIFVATQTAKLVAQSIEENSWIEQGKLPSLQKWEACAQNALLKTRHQLEAYANKREISAKELACTVIILVYSPIGLLVAHIGDGRAGYCNQQNQWLPLIKPWKGEEANQTVFITSDIWENPTDFLKTTVIAEKPIAFTLMSDGCENHAYLTGIFDHDQQQYLEINKPYPQFFDPLVTTLNHLYRQHTPEEEIKQKWTDFVTNGNAGLTNEPDDKTLILGVLIAP